MLSSYLGNDRRVEGATGLSLLRLCRRYIDGGLPVLVWATADMASVASGRSRILPDGSEFT